MSIVKSKVHLGRVEFTAPSDWPEGVEVEARPVTTAVDDDLMSPEEIERTLKARDEYFAQVFDQQAYLELDSILRENRKLDKEQTIARSKKNNGWD